MKLLIAAAIWAAIILVFLVGFLVGGHQMGRMSDKWESRAISLGYKDPPECLQK